MSISARKGQETALGCGRGLSLGAGDRKAGQSGQLLTGLAMQINSSLLGMVGITLQMRLGQKQ